MFKIMTAKKWWDAQNQIIDFKSTIDGMRLTIIKKQIVIDRLNREIKKLKAENEFLEASLDATDKDRKKAYHIIHVLKQKGAKTVGGEAALPSPETV